VPLEDSLHHGDPIVTAAELQHIFGNIEEIRNFRWAHLQLPVTSVPFATLNLSPLFSKSLLSQLQQQVQHTTSGGNIGKIFVDMVSSRSSSKKSNLYLTD
jgi:hypothetical protein